MKARDMPKRKRLTSQLPSRVPANLLMIERAYTLFDHAERNQSILTLDVICRMTGYTLKTARGYVTKKWWWFLQKHEPYGYIVQGLHHYPKSYFVSSHLQKVQPEPLPGMPVHKVKEVVIVYAHRPFQIPNDLSLLIILSLLGLWWRFSQRRWRAVWGFWLG